MFSALFFPHVSPKFITNLVREPGFHFQLMAFSDPFNCQTNSMEQSPSRETNSHSAKKFPAFYGARRFITVSTTAHHWSLSWARCSQSTPSHPN